MRTQRYVLGLLVVVLISAGMVVWTGRAFRARRLITLYRTRGNEWELSAPPPQYRGITAPWRIGVQAGHWQVEALPWELSRLRTSTGAHYGDFREVDVNLAVATKLVARLQEVGIEADLLPATVPPSYNADAFISIHADGANRPGARGWKISTPWRPSPASKTLHGFIADSYGRHTGLPQDRYGVTYNMRGYYAFSPHRFQHAIAYTTPAVIIETGFVTVAADREVLFNQQGRIVEGIVEGVVRYLSRKNPLEWQKLLPQAYPATTVTAREVPLYVLPDRDSPLKERLLQGTRVLPVDQEPGWTEVIVWRNYHRFGWIETKALQPPESSGQ